MNNIAITISAQGKITACIDGKIHTIDNTHPNYQKALDAIKAQDYQAFLDHVDLSRKVKNFILNSDVEIKDGAILYKGEAVHNTLTKRVIKFMQEDLPFKPLLNFLYNLMENPSYRAVNELYDFLDVGELPITEDGHFLAFKNVKSDYRDIHSGTFDNSVGKVCEMPRYKVDEDKDRTCSSGLHFCSINYLPHFRDSDGGKTMILKINPKDVVSIPSDYNNTKGRCCRYEVIGEYTDDWRSKLDRGENGFDSHLYSSDGGEYEDYDEDLPTDHEDEDDDSKVCEACYTDLVEGDNYDGNGDFLCFTCYDVQYSGCCGGGCSSNNVDPKANGTDGQDHLPGGLQEEKPVNIFHNLRDKLGRFIKKDQSND